MIDQPPGPAKQEYSDGGPLRMGPVAVLHAAAGPGGFFLSKNLQPARKKYQYMYIHVHVHVHVREEMPGKSFRSTHYMYRPIAFSVLSAGPSSSTFTKTCSAPRDPGYIEDRISLAMAGPELFNRNGGQSLLSYRNELDYTCKGTNAARASLTRSELEAGYTDV